MIKFPIPLLIGFHIHYYETRSQSHFSSLSAAATLSPLQDEASPNLLSYLYQASCLVCLLYSSLGCYSVTVTGNLLPFQSMACSTHVHFLFLIVAKISCLQLWSAPLSMMFSVTKALLSIPLWALFRFRAFVDSRFLVYLLKQVECIAYILLSSVIMEDSCS